MAIFDFFKSSSSSAQNGDVSDSMESRPDDRDERKTSIVETNNALVTGSEEVRKRELNAVDITVVDANMLTYNIVRTIPP